MKHTLRFATLAAALCAAPVAQATPISFGGNTYDFISSVGISWAAAMTAATGLGGHLATVTSSAENAAIAAAADRIADSHAAPVDRRGPRGT